MSATLASLRKSRRVSQLELSLRAGVSQRHLSCIETGRARAQLVSAAVDHRLHAGNFRFVNIISSRCLVGCGDCAGFGRDVYVSRSTNSSGSSGAGAFL